MSAENPPGKLHVFADESGGQGRGAFVVALAVFLGAQSEDLVHGLRSLEMASWRDRKKWKQSKKEQREAYLRGLLQLQNLFGVIYWRRHRNDDDQARKVGELVAVAIRERDPEDVTRRIVVVDALSEAKRLTVTSVLKSRGIERKEVRGGRDEAFAFLRLVDAAAGFLRHYVNGEDYAVELWSDVRKLFHEL